MDVCVPSPASTTPVSPIQTTSLEAPAVPMVPTSLTDMEPRRSGRQRTSTVIQIDGYTVRKDNNYVLKGLGYQYGDNTVAEVAPKKRKATTPSSEQRKQPKKPRIVTPVEMARQEHNHCVKARVAAKAQLRLAHLARHQSVLEPFLDISMTQKLQTIQQGQQQPVSQKKKELYLQPEAIQADLRDYQLAGLNWMAQMHQQNFGMILGDEMGLGKTLQTISLLCHLKENEGISGPSLVVCPLSVLYSWCSELKKWAPSLKILRFHSSCESERAAQRDLFTQDALSYDVVVTTYEMAKSPQLQSLWSRQYFNYLVLDEGHKIKDANSQIAQAVRGIHRENALILTGTPLQNNLVELWSLLNFLYPDVFHSSEPFAQAFDLTTNTVQKERLQDAQKLLGVFMLRRLKDEVEKLMPKKIETKVLCPLSATQVFWYKALLLKDISLLVKSTDGSPTNKGKVLNNLIMQLRKCCLHPYLFDGAEPDIEGTSVEDLISASGKLTVLDKLLRSLYTKGHRTVLFSQFTSVLDILEDYCRMRGWNYCRFDGSTARASRNYMINSFNEPGSEKFIFLMSTRSGGMGLNLQTADTCILYDSDWNPQPDLQAMARVHRIGQTKTVHVYRLISNGTVEERMVERAEKKLYMDRMVNTSGGAATQDQDETQVTDKDMVSTLQFGCNAVFGDDADTRNMLPTDEDIETITDRSRSGDFSDGKLKGGADSRTDDFEAEKELSATTKLGGIDFKAIRDDLLKKKKEKLALAVPKDLGGIADTWRQIQNEKRQSKSRLVMVNGKNSGYGKASVPVLAANNYDLANGEGSVFSRELQQTNRGAYGSQKKKSKKSGIDFDVQDFCQACGRGGMLLCCPRCPIGLHLRCAGVNEAKEFLCCSHHRCVKCNKNTEGAGGLLFACQSCPNAYCEDCRPEEARLLGDCERFEKLGFTTKRTVYIHCSEMCEHVAKVELDWKEPSRKKAPCPPPVDASDQFGAKVEEALEAKPEESPTRLRRQKAKYAESPEVGNNRTSDAAAPVGTLARTTSSPKSDARARPARSARATRSSLSSLAKSLARPVVEAQLVRAHATSGRHAATTVAQNGKKNAFSTANSQQPEVADLTSLETFDIVLNGNVRTTLI